MSDNKQVSKKEDDEKTGWDLSRQVCDLEDCLHEVLSDVIEVEMKAAYKELWLEVKLCGNFTSLDYILTPITRCIHGNLMSNIEEGIKSSDFWFSLCILLVILDHINVHWMKIYGLLCV